MKKDPRVYLAQILERLDRIKGYTSDGKEAFFAEAPGHILVTIQDFERLYLEVNRRSLQRDLKSMVDMGLLISEGATNKLVYRMKEPG